MLEGLFQTIGWVGGMAFAVSAIPQVVLCARKKNAEGVSMSLILLMMLGGACLFTFCIWNQITRGGQLPLIFNYALTFVSWLIIFCYKLYGSRGRG